MSAKTEVSPQDVYDKLSDAYGEGAGLVFNRAETITLYHLVQSMLVDLKAMKRQAAKTTDAEDQIK